jgi:hypothetical protein
MLLNVLLIKQRHSRINKLRLLSQRVKLLLINKPRLLQHRLPRLLLINKLRPLQSLTMVNKADIHQ